MTVTLDLSADVRSRLEAEAARRGITLGELITQLAAELPVPSESTEPDALHAFFGSGDSGDPSWATRDIHELRHELAARRRPESR